MRGLLAAGAAAIASAGCVLSDFDRPFGGFSTDELRSKQFIRVIAYLPTHNDSRVQFRIGADPYTVLGIDRTAPPEEMRHRYRQLALSATFDRFREATCFELWRYYSVQRSYKILRPENAGWREAYGDEKFDSQLSLDQWRPRDNEAPDLDNRGVTQFFLVDGPVTPEHATEVESTLSQKGGLDTPLVLYLYTNWDPDSQALAPEYKEAAYTVKDAEYKADFQAVDCDEPEAAPRLCSERHLKDLELPGIVIFHKGRPADRPVSVSDMHSWRVMQRTKPLWATAVSMTAWMKEELDKYQADDSPVMVDVEVEVDLPPPAASDSDNADVGSLEQHGDSDGESEADGQAFMVYNSDGVHPAEGANAYRVDASGELQALHIDAAADAADADSSTHNDNFDSSGQAQQQPYQSSNGEYGTPAPSFTAEPSYPPTFVHKDDDSDDSDGSEQSSTGVGYTTDSGRFIETAPPAAAADDIASSSDEGYELVDTEIDIDIEIDVDASEAAESGYEDEDSIFSGPGRPGAHSNEEGDAAAEDDIEPPRGGSYSLTPSAQPDPSYHRAEDVDEDEEYLQRQREWEEAEAEEGAGVE